VRRDLSWLKLKGYVERLPDDFTPAQRELKRKGRSQRKSARWWPTEAGLDWLGGLAPQWWIDRGQATRVAEGIEMTHEEAVERTKALLRAQAVREMEDESRCTPESPGDALSLWLGYPPADSSD
jgi:hypothetical protein